MNFALNNLLLSSTVTTAVLAAFCALGGALLIYGAIRRFTRSSWTGLQIVALFFILFGVSKIPFFKSNVIYFFVLLGLFLVCIAAILIVGEVLHCAFRVSTQKPKWFFRALDRLFGALNAVINFAVFVVAIGGFVLLAVFYFTTSSEGGGLAQGALGIVFNHSLWTAFGKYTADFLLVAFLTVSVKGGYKLGVFNSVWTVLMLAMTVLALFGSVYIATKMPGISTLSGKLASALAGKMNAAVAKLLGYTIVGVIAFIVLVVVIVLLNLLVNLVARKLGRIKILRFLDGALLATVVFAVSCALVCGVHFGVYSVARLAEAPPSGEVPLAEEFAPDEPPSFEEEQTPPAEEGSPEGDFSENQEGEGGNWVSQIWGTVQTFLSTHDIEAIFTSSPISNFFYTYNPILTFMGNG